MTSTNESNGKPGLSGATGSGLSETAADLLKALSQYPLNGSMWIYPEAETIGQQLITKCGKELVDAGLAATRPLGSTKNVLILELIPNNKDEGSR